MDKSNTPASSAIKPRGKYAKMTTEQRLRHVGWSERTVRPDLGPCWEWNGNVGRNGYGRITVQGQKMIYVHRVAYQEWVSDIEDGGVICHRCDNPPCMNPDHLFVGSMRDNMRDAVSKRRHAHGERSGTSKLTDAQVLEIRAAYVPWKVTQAYLAEVYGVAQPTIARIIAGEDWKHLPVSKGGAA